MAVIMDFIWREVAASLSNSHEMHEEALTVFDAAAVLMVMVAALGFLNHRFLKLPQSVAMTAMGALASLVVIGTDAVLPRMHLSDYVAAFLSRVNFQSALLDGMLSFLLFAGALHVDWPEMRRGRWPVITLSTVGVLVSSAIIGGLVFVIAEVVGLSLPLLWCLVFGALISPTDPVAVIGVLKRTNCPPSLQATVAGESLFNDGVGVVLFSILLAAAVGANTLTAASAAVSFLWQAGGGIVVGLGAGWLGYTAMRQIDEYNVELTITLAIVMGGYALAHLLGVSGPVAMAVAGLLIGNAGVVHAMDELTRQHLLTFWALLDELLNAVLFLMIGIEIIAISPDPRIVLFGALAIPVTLAARVVSVVPPLLAMRSIFSLSGPALPTLLWGGLRGGISVAMALSLPPGQARTIILTATYLVVLFSVIVQGGTIARIVERSARRNPCAEECSSD
jgi:CPA1 family monovalent cation:H+ antiporter